MGRKLLVTGGLLRENGYELGDGKSNGEAVLMRLCLSSGNMDKVISMKKGNSNYPNVHPNLQFTVADIEGDNLWLATDTEIYLYDYGSLDLLEIFSHPCFHNIHSVTVRNEYLYVTSTGLDNVVILNKYDGSIVEIINAQGKDPWHRFKRDFDYRKIHSTRPHDCHPNYVFFVNNVPWVTRCTQEDAVCLSDFSKTINISGNKTISVHDGVIKGKSVFFTSVDGCIIEASTESMQVVDVLDLNKLKGFGGVRGWCRGLFVDKDLFYVSFSRIRKTNSISKLRWLIGSEKRIHEFSSVLVIDRKNNEIVKVYDFLDGTIDTIYSILLEPEN